LAYGLDGGPRVESMRQRHSEKTTVRLEQLRGGLPAPIFDIHFGESQTAGRNVESMRSGGTGSGAGLGNWNAFRGPPRLSRRRSMNYPKRSVSRT